MRGVHEASFLVEVCPPIPRLRMATALQGRTYMWLFTQLKTLIRVFKFKVIAE